MTGHVENYLRTEIKHIADICIMLGAVNPKRASMRIFPAFLQGSDMYREDSAITRMFLRRERYVGAVRLRRLRSTAFHSLNALRASNRSFKANLSRSKLACGQFLRTRLKRVRY